MNSPFISNSLSRFGLKTNGERFDDVSLSLIESPCPALPTADLLQTQIMKKVKSEILSIIAVPSMQSFLQLQALNSFSSLRLSLQEQMISEILFSLLLSSMSSGDNEQPQQQQQQHQHHSKQFKAVTQNLKISFYILLKICPSAAKIPDSKGYLLLHYITLFMESPDHDLVKLLIFAFPSSVSSMIFSDYHGFSLTPLHLMLLKSDIDFEITLYMVVICPMVASIEIPENGKFPIHLAVTASAYDTMASSYQMRLIKKLLMEFPQGAFKEITEEVRYLRLNTSLSPSSSAVSSSSTSSSSDDAVSSTSQQQQQFVMHIQSTKWNPIEKSRTLNDSELKAIFIKFVDHMTLKHLKTQIKRH
jgi:hypothetical protein